MTSSNGSGTGRRGIANTVGWLIRCGPPTGARLTVRRLAKRLGCNQQRVSQAWQTLLFYVGAIESLGRNGTKVGNPRETPQPTRYRRMRTVASDVARSLDGNSDPELLPDLTGRSSHAWTAIALPQLPSRTSAAGAR